MNSYREYLERKTREYGAKFDPSHLAPQFIPYFENGKRIEVEYDGERLRGRVGVTTGWFPSFLLMSRRNAHGSSVLLNAGYKIVRVIGD